MNQATGIILCLAYILGLLFSAVPGGGFWVLALGILTYFTLPKLWQKYIQKSHQKRKAKGKTEKAVSSPVFSLLSSAFVPKGVWLIAGTIGLLASLYLNLRLPQPTASDISQLIPPEGEVQELTVTVRGRVTSAPHLTRSGRSQFWLDVEQVSEIVGMGGAAEVNRPVTGKLYATVPLLQATGLYPGKAIAVTGNLYKPPAASNPGAFDFRAYLAGEGSFAGLKGRQIDWTIEKAMAMEPNPSKASNSPFPFSWQAARQRIVRSQVNWLGVPEGPLVSAIALGKQAVDLPYDIRDTFVLAGLAHAIAASGTQVSLVLGLVLTITKGFSAPIRLTAGVFSLIFLLGLTGLEPSISRAAFMGLLALIAMILEREIKPLGALLLAATLLLLINPLWVRDLGFQLSFLATLGLVVTVPPLMKWLDWLPPAIAGVIAVPIAASIWTLPRLIAVFSCLVPYSILTNIIAAPAIAIISLGGFISAIAALISPMAGSAIAGLLHYPVKGLIETAEFFASLPGNSLNLGAISIFQEIILYSLIVGVWVLGAIGELQPQVESDRLDSRTRRRKRKPFLAVPLAILIAAIAISLPALKTQGATAKVTILANSKEPILVMQNQGQVALVNSGDEKTVQFTLLPFLARQGVNQINWAIAPNSYLGLSRGWSKLLERLPIATFYDNPAPQQTYYSQNQAFIKAVQSRHSVYLPLPVNQTINLGPMQAQLLNPEVPVMRFQISGQTWLFLGDIEPEAQKRLLASGTLQASQVLWWSGERLNAELLQAIGPKVAIASATSIDLETANWLQQAKTQLFWTGRDGAVVWTPTEGFQGTLETDGVDPALL